MDCFPAPPEWTPADPNPFVPNGAYGEGWSCFCIDQDTQRLNYCGRASNGLFVFRLGRSAGSFHRTLGDFLRYENLHGRSVIVAAPSLPEVDALARQALLETSHARKVRDEDPRWVVHSTASDSWQSIQSDGAVVSLAALLKDGRNISGLGVDEFNEPPDYAEYVVLGRVDEMNAEHVVSSRQKGRVVTDPDVGYLPGVRLYFDNHLIITNGLAVRDGLHVAKVRDSLPLKPYLKASVSVSDLPARTWTPKSFWEAANEVFYAEVSTSG